MTADQDKLQVSRPALSRQLGFLVLALAGLVLDLVTKHLAFSYVEPGQHIQLLPGLLRITRVLNDGAAFSLASGRQWFLVTVSVLALAAVVTWFVIAKVHARLAVMALALITAGIAGNLYDRLLNGGLVRDFIDLYVGPWHWPTFNIADTLLSVGAGLLLLANCSTRRPCQTRGQPQR